MPKEEKKKPHPKGAGAELAGKPDELIHLLTADGEKAAQAVAEITDEGPAHKQVFSALLLRRMYQLVKEIEATSGTEFSVQKGLTLQSKKEEKEISFPLPASVVKKEQLEAVADAVAHSPAHELIAFTALLQGIEWSIQALHSKQ